MRLLIWSAKWRVDCNVTTRPASMTASGRLPRSPASSAWQWELETCMKPISDTDSLLSTIAREGTVVPYRKGQVLFSQGDAADAVFSILKGKVKLPSSPNRTGKR